MFIFPCFIIINLQFLFTTSHDVYKYFFYVHNFQDFVTMKRYAVLLKHYIIILLESQILTSFTKNN
jgi:hypothetical protein